MEKIIVLTEAGFKKGFGHYHRMTSIRDLAKKNGIPFKMIIDADYTAKENIVSDDVVFSDWQTEDLEISDVVGNEDLVVVDSYNIDLNGLEIISSCCDRMIVIDDNMRLPYRGMTILNPNYFAHFLAYPDDAGNTYYLGKDYTLLREPFYYPYLREAKESVTDVLVTMGGTDPKGKTQEAISIINKVRDSSVRIHAISTGAYKNKAEIKEVLREKDRLYCDVDAETMCQLIKTCDFAVATAGGTTNELIRMQCPSAVTIVADNQELNVQYMTEAGYMKFFDFEHPDGIYSLFDYDVREGMIQRLAVMHSEHNAAELLIEMFSEEQ